MTAADWLLVAGGWAATALLGVALLAWRLGRNRAQQCEEERRGHLRALRPVPPDEGEDEAPLWGNQGGEK